MMYISFQIIVYVLGWRYPNVTVTLPMFFNNVTLLHTYKQGAITYSRLRLTILIVLSVGFLQYHDE